MKMLTAFTEELDDVDFAVSEILDQLNLDDSLLENSVGIVHCYSEFMENGIVKALNEKLPFDLVGTTTTSVSVPGESGQLALSLIVLTSDDARFACGVSEPVENDPAIPVKNLYEGLTAGLTEKPALLMPFCPFMFTVPGDEFVEAIDKVSDGITAFGALAISGNLDFSQSYTTYNGEYYTTSIVLLAIFGDVHPTFFSANVSDRNILEGKAIITDIEHNLLHTVNGMPAIKYFESKGLISNKELTGLQSMPVICYLEDGSKLIRVCIQGTDDGSAILGGNVPLNTPIALATIVREDVIQATEMRIEAALPVEEGKCILMYSCAVRSWALGLKWAGEHDVAHKLLGDIPYSLCYAGGEIFPSLLKNGKSVNLLQNDSFTICVL